MLPDDVAARVARARGASSNDELVALYREWAEHYDHDVVDGMGLVGSARIADLLAEHLPERGTAVIDLGCGTGLVGERLAAHGFATVDGVDLSPEMLAIAAHKGCYRHVVAADLHDAASLPRGPYGASISAGTFTSGHVGPEAVGGVLSVCAPGAVVAWVVAAVRWPEFAEALDRAGVTTELASVEPIRRDGPAESVMFVGRRR